MISLKHLYSFSWNKFKPHWKFIIPLGIITTFVEGFVNWVQQAAVQQNSILGLALWITSILVSVIIGLGWAQIFLALIRGNSVSWETFKSDQKLWLFYIKGMIWYFLFVFGCSLLVVLPFAILAIIGFFTEISWMLQGAGIAGLASLAIFSIYVSIKYQFIFYSAVDHPNLDPKHLYKKTGALVPRAVFLKVLLVGIVGVFLCIIGLLVAGVGLLVAVPVVKIAQAKLYDELKQSSEQKSLAN